VSGIEAAVRLMSPKEPDAIASHSQLDPAACDSTIAAFLLAALTQPSCSRTHCRGDADPSRGCRSRDSDLLTDARPRSRSEKEWHFGGAPRLTPSTVPVTVECPTHRPKPIWLRWKRPAESWNATTMVARSARLDPSLARIVSVEATAGRAHDLAKVPGVLQVRLDAPLDAASSSLDFTADLVGAKATWGMHDTSGVPLTGEGITTATSTLASMSFIR